MNRRDLFRRLAALALATIPATRAAASPARDYSDRHGALTLIGEPGPELITMPTSWQMSMAPTGTRLWIGDVELPNVKSVTYTATGAGWTNALPFHWDRGDLITTGPIILEFD